MITSLLKIDIILQIQNEKIFSYPATLVLRFHEDEHWQHLWKIYHITTAIIPAYTKVIPTIFAILKEEDSAVSDWTTLQVVLY